MKEIIITKSQLALAKGLGKSTTDIAKELGVTIQDTRAAMKSFGLMTERDYSQSKGYTVKLVDDVNKEEVVSAIPTTPHKPEKKEEAPKAETPKTVESKAPSRMF